MTLIYPILLFVIGGSVGWIIDTLDRSVERGSFEEKSVLHIPFLPIYGFGAVLLYLSKPFLPSMLVPQFLMISVLLGALEYIGGQFSTHILKRRLWTYKTKWNLHGHTDLYHALAWGVLGMGFLVVEPFIYHFLIK